MSRTRRTSWRPRRCCGSRRSAAHANAGLAHKVGSWTPGKEADITLIRTTDVNTAPGSNAVATVTAFAHAGNVDTVLVAGQIRKWRGQLTGHDMNTVTAQVLASRDYLFAASHQRARRPG